MAVCVSIDSDTKLPRNRANAALAYAGFNRSKSLQDRAGVGEYIQTRQRAYAPALLCHPFIGIGHGYPHDSITARASQSKYNDDLYARGARYSAHYQPARPHLNDAKSDIPAMTSAVLNLHVRYVLLIAPNNQNKGPL